MRKVAAPEAVRGRRRPSGSRRGPAERAPDAADLIARYALRHPTISEHAERTSRYLGLRPFESRDRRELRLFIRKEVEHLEQVSGLLAAAEGHLRRQGLLLPAESTLCRVVGEEGRAFRKSLFEKVESTIPQAVKDAIDGLLIAERDESETSALQSIKEPPGSASPRAILAERDKLDAILATGAMDVDLSWVRGALRKSLSHRVRQSSAHRLRELVPGHRYAAMLCFLQEVHGDTIDQVVDLHAKVMTQTYRGTKNRLDKEYSRNRRSLVAKLSTLAAVGEILLDPELPDRDLRGAVFSRVLREVFESQVKETRRWLSEKSDLFPKVAARYAYFRRFSRQVLERLHLEPEATTDASETRQLVASVDLLRRLNAERKRSVPEGAPPGFVPKSVRPFLEVDGSIDRAAYECAVLTAIRDEVRSGNIAVRGSKRFGRLEDLFMPPSAWEIERSSLFEKAGLPALGQAAAGHVSGLVGQSYDRFLDTLPRNAFVEVNAEAGWKLGSDPAEQMDAIAEERLARLNGFLEEHMRRIRLPDLLIAVDNEVRFSRFLSRDPRQRSQESVCQAVAAVMAYGCNLGPETMARLTPGVSYARIKRVADWNLPEEALRAALAQIVNAIGGLSTSNVWGEAKTASSDGQRFLFPRRSARRTYSHRMGDYALEFYSFIADHYAPFFSFPIECSERDAAYVLDGLRYYEADLEIDEHYVDTHGLTEANFAGFAMLGLRFASRIRGLRRQSLYHADRQRDYGALAEMLRPRDRLLRLDWIAEQWDRMGQFFCSMATGHATASVSMKRIVGFGPRNRLYRAIRELGRALKTVFLLDYLSQPDLRRRVRRGLLKSEELHALARSVFYGKLGKADWRDFRRQMSTASCLLLILAAIIYWQIREIERVTAEAADDVPTDLLVHVSPISWENVVLYGEYRLRPELVALG